MNKTALLLAVCCCPIVGHAMTFDMRGGYKEASHNYESRFKMSQSFKSGYWLSMETDNKQGDDNFDQSTVSYNEIEGNYKYTLNPKITIQPE